MYMGKVQTTHMEHPSMNLSPMMEFFKQNGERNINTNPLDAFDIEGLKCKKYQMMIPIFDAQNSSLMIWPHQPTCYATCMECVIRMVFAGE